MRKDYRGLTRAELDTYLVDKLLGVVQYLNSQTTFPSGTFFTGVKDKAHEELVVKVFTNVGEVQIELLGVDGTDLHTFYFTLGGTSSNQLNCHSIVYRGFNIVNTERTKEIALPLHLEERELRGYLLDLVSNIRKREYVLGFLLSKNLDNWLN